VAGAIHSGEIRSFYAPNVPINWSTPIKSPVREHPRLSETRIRVTLENQVPATVAASSDRAINAVIVIASIIAPLLFERIRVGRVGRDLVWNSEIIGNRTASASLRGRSAKIGSPILRANGDNRYYSNIIEYYFIQNADAFRRALFRAFRVRKLVWECRGRHRFSSRGGKAADRDPRGTSARARAWESVDGLY